MNTFKITLINIFIIFLIFSCSSNNNEIEDNSIDTSLPYEELNISYGNDSEQVFDLYLPANRNNTTKTVILVHGGGWTSGDKSDMNPIRDLIKLQLPQYAIVNINYRLANETQKPYPMQIDDISSVINFIKSNAAQYTLSNTFGFIGVSAGGHLSLLWSYAFDDQNNVNMVCSIVGPTNFTDPDYLNNTDPDIQELLDLYGDETINFLEEVSPLHQATIQSPPTILFYGGQDPLIPTTQGTGMRDKLIELGVDHEFTLYESEGHGWTGTNLLDTWSKLIAFMESNL